MGASQGKVALAQGFATLQREPRPSTDPLWDTLLQVECTEVDLFAALSPAGAPYPCRAPLRRHACAVSSCG
jgi:hypothetical protein